MSVLASATGDAESYPIEPLAVAAQTALDTAGWGEWELSVLLCDDAFIQPLNQDWRGKDVPTDVLSFPQIDHTEGAPAEPGLLGDIVLSIETAGRQAEELGHDTQTEALVLLVHGIAHLLGHTHEDDDDRARMVAAESRMLTALGLDAVGLVQRSVD